MTAVDLTLISDAEKSPRAGTASAPPPAAIFAALAQGISGRAAGQRKESPAKPIAAKTATPIAASAILQKKAAHSLMIEFYGSSSFRIS